MQAVSSQVHINYELQYYCSQKIWNLGFYLEA